MTSCSFVFVCFDINLAWCSLGFLNLCLGIWYYLGEVLSHYYFTYFFCFFLFFLLIVPLCICYTFCGSPIVSECSVVFFLQFHFSLLFNSSILYWGILKLRFFSLSCVRLISQLHSFFISVLISIKCFDTSILFWFVLKISVSLLTWSICSCMLSTLSTKAPDILIIVA